MVGKSLGSTRLGLQEWLRSESGSEAGTLGKLGLQGLVEMRRLGRIRGSSGRGRRAGAVNGGWVAVMIGITGVSC